MSDLNILYCGDKNIECGVLYSMLSLLNNTNGPLHIYLLTAGLDAGDVKLEAMPLAVVEGLDWLVKSVSEEHFVKRLDASSFFQTEVPSANLRTRFTPGCMLRLYADCFPELPDKVLYLDYDVVCRRDCRELYDQDISDCELAGVPDHYGRWFFRGDYVNSGVLLMNLARMRQTGLLGRCRRRCMDKRMFLPDQSALNALAKEKKLLPRRYNDQRRLHEDTILQHFTTTFRVFPWPRKVSVKPWQIESMHRVLGNHEYDGLYEAYQAAAKRLHGDQREAYL